MSDDEGACLSVTLPGQLDAIESARALALEFARRTHSTHASAIARLPLVLEELITNSVQHGKAAGDGAIHIELASETPHVVLHYADNGAAFDPRADVPADPRDSLATTGQIGGLGWPLITHFFEIASYERREHRNVLVLTSRG